MIVDAEATFIQVPLRDLFGFLLRGLPFAILLSVFAIAGVWYVTQQRPVSWTAVAHLLSTRPEFTPTVVPGVIPGTLDPTLYRAAVSDGPVLDAVRRDWAGPGELPDDHTLLSNLRVLSDNQLRSSVVRVEYRANHALQAAAIANAVAQQLVAWDQERALRPLQDWRDRLQAELAVLTGQLATQPDLQVERDQRLRDLAQLESTLPIPQLSLLSAAEPPAEPDGRGRLTAAAVTGVIAVLVAYLLQLTALVRRRSASEAETVRKLEVESL